MEFMGVGIVKFLVRNICGLGSVVFKDDLHL